MSDRLEEGRRQQERLERLLESRINSNCHLSAYCVPGTIVGPFPGQTGHLVGRYNSSLYWSRSPPGNQNPVSLLY